MKGLPAEAAIYRDMDPEAAAWGTTQELLAELIEHIDAGNRLLFSVHRTKGQKMPAAVRIRRPGSSDEPEPIKQQARHEDVVRFFGGGR